MNGFEVAWIRSSPISVQSCWTSVVQRRCCCRQEVWQLPLSCQDARTIRTLPGKRWRNNSCISGREFIAQKLLHSTKERWWFAVFGAELLLESSLLWGGCLFRTSYRVELGMLMMRSRNSIANSGDKEATMCSNLCCDSPGRELLTLVEIVNCGVGTCNTHTTNPKMSQTLILLWQVYPCLLYYKCSLTLRIVYTCNSATPTYFALL